MAQLVKNSPANSGDARDLGSIMGQEDPLEEEMAVHSSIPTWKTHGQRSLLGYSPWGLIESEARTHTSADPNSLLISSSLTLGSHKSVLYICESAYVW